MCRMVGLVAEKPVAIRSLLTEAPRSLRVLSQEHRDGWGIATVSGGGWEVLKGTECALESSRFSETAKEITTHLAIAHIRQKTVGPTSLKNTHPFRREKWVLAHNGTVERLDEMRAHCSKKRLSEIEGDTDSEVLFAFLMTFIDEHSDNDAGVKAAVRQLHQFPKPGAVNFLLSDGDRMYAYRFGRTLFLLDRTINPARRTPAVAIASERLTDENWTELAQGTLLVIRSTPQPNVEFLR